MFTKNYDLLQFVSWISNQLMKSWAVLLEENSNKKNTAFFLSKL